MLHVERALDNNPESTVAAHPRWGTPLPEKADYFAATTSSWSAATTSSRRRTVAS
jgi:hypothetical protein